MKKRSLPGFVAALVIFVSAIFAGAEGPPVILTQTLAGYVRGPDSVTVEYLLHVRNREKVPLGRLSLAVVPRPPLEGAKATVTVDALGANAEADVRVKLVAPLLRDETFFERVPLVWAGSYTGEGGKVVKFAVKSRPGGAQ